MRAALLLMLLLTACGAAGMQDGACQLVIADQLSIDIYSVGDALALVASHDSEDVIDSAVWAADGSAVLFASRDMSVFEFGRYTSTGAEVVPMPDGVRIGAMIGMVVPAPEPGRFAYGDINFNSNVYLYNPDTAASVPVIDPTPDFIITKLVWSPDSSRLAVFRDHISLESFIVDIVDAAGARTAHYEGEGGLSQHFSWSADSASIAWEHVRSLASGARIVSALDVATGVAADLGAARMLVGWTPDNRVVLRTDAGLETVDPTTPDDRALLVAADEIGGLTDAYSLSPDGTRLAYWLRRGTATDLIVRDIASGRETSLTLVNNLVQPLWSPDCASAR